MISQLSKLNSTLAESLQYLPTALPIVSAFQKLRKVCSQEIWVWDPNIAKWCRKLQEWWKMAVHLVILEGCTCETGIPWNLRLEPNCPHEQQATQVVWTNLHRRLQARGPLCGFSGPFPSKGRSAMWPHFEALCVFFILMFIFLLLAEINWDDIGMIFHLLL